MPMRPQTQRLSAAGNAPWIPLNRYGTSIAIQLGVIFSSNKNLTASVQYTNDLLVDKPAQFSRSTTTMTITLANHGLSVNDSVIVKGIGQGYDGTYAVASVVDQDNFTYTVTDAGPTAGVTIYVIPLRVTLHEVLQGLTANLTSNFTNPPTACRLICSSYTAGYVDLNVIPGSK